MSEERKNQSIKLLRQAITLLSECRGHNVTCIRLMEITEEIYKK